MRYINGRTFEGGWLNDMRHGKGYERYQNGNVYEGEFIEGKAEGKGVYKWSNGEVYDGEWKGGLKHGDGVWKGIHGDSYIGEWKSSKADGYGVHIWTNGDRYEGEWKECLKHGNGTDIFSNGDVYIGQYRYGKPYGNGQYIWKNGSSYVGEFKNGLKCGQGKWKKSKEQNSNQYEGQYTDDKKNGFGIFKWSSGNIYRGQFTNDERDGIGEMRWTDGSVYLGQWVRGIQHGYGKMIFPDGSLKEGYFDNNIYKGEISEEKKIPAELMDKGFSISKLDPLGRGTPVMKKSMLRLTRGKFTSPPVGNAIMGNHNMNPSISDTESITSDLKLPRYKVAANRAGVTHPKLSMSGRLLSAKSTISSLRGKSVILKPKRSIASMKKVWIPSGKPKNSESFVYRSKSNFAIIK